MKNKNQVISLHEGIQSTFDWKKLISSNPHWLVKEVGGFPNFHWTSKDENQSIRERSKEKDSPSFPLAKARGSLLRKRGAS
jgi:hypothetical protein